MISGPFVDQVRGAEAAIALRRARDPRCSRCGSTDRLRFFASWDDIFGVWSARALCYRCDDLGLTAGSQPRSSHSSLRAFYAWLLIAFIAGALVGTLIASAFSGARSTEQLPSGASSALTSSVDRGPVRAEQAPVEVQADRVDAMALRTSDRTPSGAVHGEPTARTTAIDEPPASEPATHTQSVAPPRDDPALVLAASIAVADGLTGPVPMSGAKRDRGSEQEAAARQRALAAIDAAAAEFGHEAERMRVVTFCESRWDPLAVGDAGTSFGLWQFQLATWRANVRRAGFGYSDADVFDPVASSRVAAWMWANGGELLWTCAR